MCTHRTLIRAILLAAVAAVGFTAPVAAQPSEASVSPHQMLERLGGEYDTVIRVRMAPGAASETSYGYARLVPVLGGRFLLEEKLGHQLGGDYEGLRLYGFNEATRTYEAAWAYTESSAILLMEGARDTASPTLRFSGSFLAPDAGRSLVRANISPRDGGFVVELLGRAPDGSDFVVVETAYSRRGDGGSTGPVGRGASALLSTVGEWTAEIEYRGGDNRMRRGTASLSVTPLDSGDGVAHQYRASRNGRPFTALDTYRLVSDAVLLQHSDSASGSTLSFRGTLAPDGTMVRTRAFRTDSPGAQPVDAVLQVVDANRFRVEWSRPSATGSREPLVRIEARRGASGDR